MKGHFKTAYLQREIPLDIVLADDVEVGDVVTLTGGTFKDANGDSKDCVFVTKKTYSDASSLVPASGDHIIAQSDMTLKSGAVPTKSTDVYAYYYDKVVKANITTTGASSGDYDAYNGTTYYKFVSGKAGAKRGAFYKVTNLDDVWYTQY